MKSPSRRTLLRWIGTLVPALGVAAAWESSEPFGPALLEILGANQREAARGLGAWILRQGVTPASLDALDGGRGKATADIQDAFDKDSLIPVDGFLLPAGFCRYCVAAYQHYGRI